MFSLSGLTEDDVEEFQKEVGISEGFIQDAEAPAFAEVTILNALKAVLFYVSVF